MATRKPLRGERSLKRRTTPRETEPVDPEDWATEAQPIGACRNCEHHTSAWIGGSCTAFVLDSEGVPRWCGCDCRSFLGTPVPGEDGG